MNSERDGAANLALCSVIERPAKSIQVYFSAYPADFLQKMVDVVMRGLSQLGQSGRESVVRLLAKKPEVRLSDAVLRPEYFLRGLAQVFGSGTYVLESSIVDEIVTEFALHERPSSLAHAVEAAARRCEETEVNYHRSPCPGYPPGLGMT